VIEPWKILLDENIRAHLDGTSIGGIDGLLADNVHRNAPALIAILRLDDDGAAKTECGLPCVRFVIDGASARNGNTGRPK